ncbi:MAG: hypothetical protein SOT18_01315 [Eubacterium sp.]|nr:hypothetical protein [Eubacterium sp.]
MKKILSLSLITMLFLSCAATIFPSTTKAASKAQTKKWLISKTWSNKVDDPLMEFSSKYTFKFKKNGTVVLRGYRNKDIGTYKMTGKNKAKLTFKKLYINTPGEGWGRLNGKYTATITIKNKKRFRAKFKNATESNVTNGYFY